MKIDLNKVISQYSVSNLEIDGIYKLTIPKGSKDLNRRTMKGGCGIVVPVRGKAKFTLDKHHYYLESGRILFAGSNIPLDKMVLGDSEWEYFLLHYKIIEESKKSKTPLSKMHFVVDIDKVYCSEIYNYMRQMIQYQNSGGVLDKLKSKTKLYSVIDTIFQYAKESLSSSENELIQKIIIYIHDNFNKYITVGNLANKINMDSKQFYYIFSKIVGISPKQYLIQYRINHAKYLLLQENYSINEIAKMVGYEDAFNFSRIFKKHTGLAPSFFRKRFGKNP
ncbi:helix-turn-helix domain-containing protein [Sporosalibacterium faouarense]|uniref:helix-turn-helix domain-containing protein n=1 Tax=Sporosalibacterium faouarense TaxID=516123 RepID=UPI00141D2148|nr:helix-turn-helix transcriptional regulator [Bacillota bacterium]